MDYLCFGAYNIFTVSWCTGECNQLVEYGYSFHFLCYYPVSQLPYHSAVQNASSMEQLISTRVVARFVLYTVRRLGLRGANIATSVLILLGNWIRYAGTVPSVKSYGVVIFGHILTAMAQPFCLATPTKLSDTWFTEKGRTSATALATLANPFGAAIGQFVGSVLAPTPDKMPQMILVVAIVVSLSHREMLWIDPSNPMLEQSSVAALPSFFIPAKPPTPPSATTTVDSTPIMVAIRDIIKRKEFWLIAVPFGVYVGLFNSTTSLINQVVIPYGYSETEGGIAGGILIGVGLVSAAITSPLNDRFKWYLGAIRLLVPVSGIMYVCLIYSPASPYGIWPTYLVGAILGASSFSMLPIALEFLAEITYPYSPEVGSTISWAGGQLFGGIFIIILSQLTAPATANPPYNMHNSLVFSAVVAMVFVPFPLTLSLLDRQLAERRQERERAAAGGTAGSNAEQKDRIESADI